MAAVGPATPAAIGCDCVIWNSRGDGSFAGLKHKWIIRGKRLDAVWYPTKPQSCRIHRQNGKHRIADVGEEPWCFDESGGRTPDPVRGENRSAMWRCDEDDAFHVGPVIEDQ